MDAFKEEGDMMNQKDFVGGEGGNGVKQGAEFGLCEASLAGMGDT